MLTRPMLTLIDSWLDQFTPIASAATLSVINMDSLYMHLSTNTTTADTAADLEWVEVDTTTADTVADLEWFDAIAALDIRESTPSNVIGPKINYERCTFGNCAGMSKKRRAVCHEDVAHAREILGDRSSLLTVTNNYVQLCRAHTKELFPRLRCIEHGCANLVARVNVHNSTLTDGKMYKCYKHARVLCTAVAAKSPHGARGCGDRVVSSHTLKRVRRCKRVAAHLLDTPLRALCNQCAAKLLA